MPTTVNQFIDWSAPFHAPPWEATDNIPFTPGVTTVYDLLTAPLVIPALDPVTQGQGQGIYVTGLGGVDENPATGFWWVYLVDGKEPNVGCAAYVLNGGESVVWDYKHFSSGLKQATHPGM
jgi:hypothetical protein